LGFVLNETGTLFSIALQTYIKKSLQPKDRYNWGTLIIAAIAFTGLPTLYRKVLILTKLSKGWQPLLPF